MPSPWTAVTPRIETGSAFHEAVYVICHMVARVGLVLMSGAHSLTASQNWSGVGGLARCVTAWTSRQGGCEGDDKVSADRRDRVCHMSFGTDGRRLGAGDFGKPQAPRIDRWGCRRLRGK